MRPASIAEISGELDVLFGSGIPYQRGINPDKVAATYISALKGYTVESIRAGVTKFLRGECDVSDRFIPTPPQLARIVRAAVVPPRIPEERQLPREFHRPIPGGRERMQLKLLMFQTAWGSAERIDALARANAEGFAAMVVLAVAWGCVVPESLLALPEPEAERQWLLARNHSLAEIERSPPPYLRSAARYAKQQAARESHSRSDASQVREVGVERAELRARYGITADALAGIPDAASPK